MYYYIKGKIVHRDETSIAVDANGVAYYIMTTLSSLAAFGSVGDMATVYTYLNVREDAMELYGFASEEEKRMFMLLISVSGVGPKAATAVLSTAPASKIAAAIASGDRKALTRAQGIGPKAAERILLELRDKVNAEDLGITSDGGGEATADTDMKREAVSALVALGYSLNEARIAVGKAGGGTVEEIIKKALTSF